MILEAFESVVIPELTNDFKTNIENLFTSNHKQAIYRHVQRVATTNSEIAEKFHLNKEVCIQAAYCHDIAGIINENHMLQYARDYNMPLDVAEEKYPFLLHQRFSALLAMDMFKINDERILSAIAYHSTLKSNPSQYDMALFVADKLSWDQDGAPPYLQIIQSEIDKSLYHASLAYIEFVLNHNMILYPHHWLVEAYEWLKMYRCDGFN
ncbi:bis(5'-nucleosyl)-tetraphosphatase (symmetrical) YqeK [Desulfosporosinus sp. PR]|uniref:bis(5'-nucleosyl)-tetraphosphatase (symmetrical) YqeK n=1 Tax=Candidatus Desulfosporosinus nitrosoreducens TaxID=3401928 RepID=UPI0027E7AC18|nr:bis(5'-nucleosyl)-tetraphosphatase (symmetrical) YqeK [Desulfosporosinus sp. PR]MDQ7094570.1 bis(5'-nucleosyl)-tetraphosphatase (symmetrical) YqeK [Desulfosporosinus sp. PR]